VARRVHPGRASRPRLRNRAGPVDDAKKSSTAPGYVNGTIIGIPKGVKHKDQAWALLKYLTFMRIRSRSSRTSIRNVPTTKESLNSKEIKPDAHFKTFLTDLREPELEDDADHGGGQRLRTLIQAFAVKWQAGHAGDLHAGLKKLDKQIDAQLKQAQAGGVP
jgi:multiple sugar transport system substrate-binding protein